MNAKQKLHQANLDMWNNRFREQAQSGLSVKNWCTLNDISIHAYNYWKHVAKEAYLDSILPDIVPLANPEDPAPDYSEDSKSISSLTPSQLSLESRDLHNSCNSLHISINDIHMEFGSAVSDDVILNIIKAVRYA